MNSSSVSPFALLLLALLGGRGLVAGRGGGRGGAEDVVHFASDDTWEKIMFMNFF